MLTKIQKWGNSLGLRIPKSFASEASLKAGSTVDITLENGDLVVSPVRRPQYSLKELLRRIDTDNRHEEIPSGEPVGREAW